MDWTTILISSGTGRPVAGVLAVANGWLGFGWQRRLWTADARQGGLERREERVQAVLTSVVRYAQRLEQAVYADRLKDAVERDACFDERRRCSPNLEVLVAMRLDRLTPPLPPLAVAALDAYRRELNARDLEQTLLQQDPRRADAPGRAEGQPQGAEATRSGLAALREAVLVVTDHFSRPAQP
jgi:hypothetical protein